MPENKGNRVRLIAMRAGAFLCGCLVALLCAEAGLRVAHIPRFYQRHSAPPQFAILSGSVKPLLWVNIPSADIRFVYDGNPRGYFDAENAVDHVTNSFGFRGPAFSKAKGTGRIRLAFLGDSFTFGEGVRFEDTYAEKCAQVLNRSKRTQSAVFESYNFGVSGFNTVQEAALLKRVVWQFQPDIVIVGLTINDAEGELLYHDLLSDTILRHDREAIVPEGVADIRPPDARIYQLRLAQLLWQAVTFRQKTHATIAYYRGLYDPERPEWQAASQALVDIITECGQRHIPCCVVMFPLLHKLSAGYPFRDIHGMLAEKVNAAGGIWVDLLDELDGMSAPSLWVHPTDQHPNEQVHALAARAIAAHLEPAIDNIMAQKKARQATVLR